MAKPFEDNEEDEQKPAVDLGLSAQDQQAIGKGIGTDPEVTQDTRKAALMKMLGGTSVDDATKNGQLYTGAGPFGGLGSIAEEAVPAAKSFVNEAATPLWNDIKPAMEGTSPNASSATADAVNHMRNYVDDLGQQFGFSHPKVQYAQAMLNRMRGLK